MPQKESKEEEELCKEKFEELYGYACKHGNTPDQKWYELGFPADKNADGEDVLPQRWNLSKESSARKKNESSSRKRKAERKEGFFRKSSRGKAK